MTIFKEGISKNDIVTIDYTAKLRDGLTVLSTEHEGPLTFKVGDFSLVKGFNQAVLGMKIGEKKKVVFNPDEAFGEVKKNLILEVLLSKLPPFVKIGQRIITKNSRRFFNVVNIDSDQGMALLDGNHKLAGQTLHFHLKILSIKYPPKQKPNKRVRFGEFSGRYEIGH